MKNQSAGTEMKSNGFVLGVDVGGTKIRVARINRTGRIDWTRMEPVKAESLDSFLSQVTTLCREALNDRSPSGCDGLGVAVPAVIARDHDTILLAPNLPVLNECRLRSELSARLGCDRSNVALGYDGTASVIGEVWRGAGQGHQSVVTAVFGTGIGGGLFLEGKVIHGANNVAGALGWFRLAAGQAEPPLEEFCAGPGIVRQALDLLRQHHGWKGSLAGLLTNPDLPKAKLVFDAAEAGDNLAQAIIENVVRRVGIGLANLISLVNPEVVVLSGSVGLRLAKYRDDLLEIIQRTAQPVAAQSVKILPSSLGDLEVVIGAAGLIFWTKEKMKETG